MTVREQLAEQASRPRPVLVRNYVSSLRDRYKTITLPLDREISLTARMLDPSLLTKLVRVGVVNAAAVCGIPAHHLLVTGFRIDPPDDAYLNAASDYPVHIELLDSPSPLRGSPEVDFEALLDALDSGSVPPETWHDRPPLL
jgi:hypothetical protein